MSTIRVTVEVPELTHMQLAVLQAVREHKRLPRQHEWDRDVVPLFLYGPCLELRGDRMEPTDVGRAVLEHYEAQR